MKKKLYTCFGENFIDGVEIGYCGDAHTLDKWIEILFESNPEQAKEYFEGAPDKEIVEYIQKYKGKRLETRK